MNSMRARCVRASCEDQLTHLNIDEQFPKETVLVVSPKTIRKLKTPSLVQQCAFCLSIFYDSLFNSFFVRRPPSDQSLKCELIIDKNICMRLYGNKFQIRQLYLYPILPSETSSIYTTIPCLSWLVLSTLAFEVKAKLKRPSGNVSDITGTEWSNIEREG